VERPLGRHIASRHNRGRRQRARAWISDYPARISMLTACGSSSRCPPLRQESTGCRDGWCLRDRKRHTARKARVAAIPVGGATKLYGGGDPEPYYTRAEQLHQVHGVRGAAGCPANYRVDLPPMQPAPTVGMNSLQIWHLCRVERTRQLPRSGPALVVEFTFTTSSVVAASACASVPRREVDDANACRRARPGRNDGRQAHALQSSQA